VQYSRRDIELPFDLQRSRRPKIGADRFAERDQPDTNTSPELM